MSFSNNRALSQNRMKIDGLVDANWEWFMNCQILEDVAFHRLFNSSKSIKGL